MGLYQKYRPATLDDMAGNTETIAAFKAHFAQEPHRISHAHIISGDSGCGKTTMARAVARSILGATDLTIHEVNTADNRGIDTIREIIDQTRFKPIGGKSLVFIIDEAHGLTNDAKKALLKPLEDAPAHVFYFLCTTDLKTLLKGDGGKAVGTRCTKWEVKPLSIRQSTQLVSRTAKAENFDLDPDVLSAIVEASNGSPRALLVNLEKVMPVKDKEGQLAVVDGHVGEDPDAIELCRALLARKWPAVVRSLSALKAASKDPEEIRRCVLGYAQACILKGGTDEGAICAMLEFQHTTYDSGFPALVAMCLRTCKPWQRG